MSIGSGDRPNGTVPSRNCLAKGCCPCALLGQKQRELELEQLELGPPTRLIEPHVPHTSQISFLSFLSCIPQLSRATVPFGYKDRVPISLAIAPLLRSALFLESKLVSTFKSLRDQWSFILRVLSFSALHTLLHLCSLLAWLFISISGLHQGYDASVLNYFQRL